MDERISRHRLYYSDFSKPLDDLSTFINMNVRLSYKINIPKAYKPY